MARLNTRLRSSEPNRTPGPSLPISNPDPDSDLSGSDKENPRAHTSAASGKRDSTSISMSNSAEARSSSSVKRRRTENNTEMESSQIILKKTLKEKAKFYDPDQNQDERRELKKNIRGLASRLNDSTAEYLQSDSQGLVLTLKEADELFKGVKQTSDATIDSRLLVATADLSYKKVNSLTLGDSSIGVDVDDFVTRCIRFMRQGDQQVVDRNDLDSRGPEPSQTQRRRQQQTGEEDAESGDALNWAYLGKNACFLHNMRPCVSGFLLGPLSVQKKVRQHTQRREREAAVPSQVVRPMELTDEDLDKQESANLTVVCAEIAQLLERTQVLGESNVEKEVDERGGNVSEEELYAIICRHGIADNGCVPLFNFCVNPQSFGQTIENLFYVSFLIKEGKVGLEFDKRGLPTLGVAGQRSVAERQETQRNQAVFTLDFNTWEDIIESHGIEKSIIPHRREEVYDDGTIDFTERNESDEQDASISS